MIFLYKFLKIITYSIFVILVLIAVYYSILVDYFSMPDKTKIEKFKISKTSVIYDVDQKPLYYLFDKQFRFYTNPSEVKEKIWSLLFNKEYLITFLPEFYKENSIKNISTEDVYKNYILKEIYFFDDSLKSRMLISKLRKNLGDLDFKELIINYLKFSESIYGLESIAYFLFNKTITQLSDAELLYCLANINFHVQSNNFKFDLMKEKYLSIVNFVKKYFPDEFNIGQSENPEPNVKNINFVQNEGYLNDLDAGISYDLMLYYLKDYLINQKNFINLTNNGYEIFTSFDLSFLKKVIMSLGITGAEKCNKICAIYYQENGNYYMLGILNLPYGRNFIYDTEKLSSTLKYKNNPVTLLVLPILRYSYIDLYNKNNTGVIPVLKIKNSN
ncbi:hypothetical protein KA977_03290 [Candidatus Dependentiae bacterium]|nr:hypothetical protein [Candidatus Dependentiae bacterium]